MAKSHGVTKASQSSATAKAAAHQTDSAPSATAPDLSNDPAVQKMVQTNNLAASMPLSPNKAFEHGFENGLHPQAGAVVEPASRLPGGSTLTEENSTLKTGSMAPEGVNATIEPLDHVRVDSSGQMLTTQGVAIADNQNSLKMGVRGPALLEDFILREKITHFDHERIPERIVYAHGSAAHGFLRLMRH